MMQITNYNNKSQSLKYSKSFGRGNDPFYSDNKSMSEKEKAEKMKELANKISDSNKGPSAIRSFAIVSALTAASALTGAAISGRFFNIFNKLGAFKSITPKIAKTIEATSSKLRAVETGESAKGKFIIVLREAVSGLEKNSIYGIEEKLAKLNSDKTKKFNNIKRTVLRKKPELKGNKDAVNEAVNNAISKNNDYQDFFTNIDKQIQDLKGTNIARKTTKATAATVMGVGALREASRDNDQNGVPDCIEYAHAKKDATQKVTAALLDCAFDTI